MEKRSNYTHDRQFGISVRGISKALLGFLTNGMLLE